MGPAGVHASGCGPYSGQIETLARLVHQRYTAPKLFETVETLAARMSELPEPSQVVVRELRRDLKRRRALPESFVAERARTTAEAYTTWVVARPRDDFGAVKPLLEKIVALCRQEASLYGYEEHPYDALLDGYEPGARLSMIKPLLLRVAERSQGFCRAPHGAICLHKRAFGQFPRSPTAPSQLQGCLTSRDRQLYRRTTRHNSTPLSNNSRTA